jgi:hypothetical protein
VAADIISASTGGFNNNIRTTASIRKFGDGTGSGIAGHLNSGHDKVTGLKGDGVAVVVDASAMSGTTFFGEKTEDLFRELSGRRAKTEEGMDIGSLIFSRCWRLRDADIEREAERSTNGRNASDDVGAIDGTAVPGICSSMAGFNEDRIGATVIGCDGDGFVKVSMEFFNANSHMITASGDVKSDIQKLAHILKKAFEIAAIVDDD